MRTVQASTPAACCVRITKFTCRRSSTLVRAANKQQPHQQHDGSNNWLPPAQWVSSVLSNMQQSVDVDNMEAYTQLLQEALVLQPSLLRTQPAAAAATCWQLERYTRSSVVWFGPEMISHTLTLHTPVSLQQHLSHLMALWTSHGQLPHTFGQLWLHAPSALLQRDVTQFESYLNQLQQLVPELPPSELLASSASLAGFLLSLSDVTQLEGHIHRELPGVIVFSHPCLHHVRVTDEECTPNPQQQQQPGLRVVSVYAVIGDAAPTQQQQQQQQQQEADSRRQDPAAAAAATSGAPVPLTPAAAAGRHSAAASSSNRQQQQQVPPWQQEPESKYTGGVYELPYQGGAQAAGGSSSSSGSNELQLLGNFKVWVGGSGAPPVPLLVLPPQQQQQR